jgi:predicted membrane protein
MIDALESLSFGTATLVVALIAGTISGVLFYLIRRQWRWVFPAIVPIITAYVIYWAPVRRGADTSEYSAWAGLFLVFWSGAGIIMSCAICWLIRKSQKG